MAVLTAAGATASEKKIDLKDLPPAVQAAVQVHARDATGYSLSVEEEDGKATYEIETKTNGLSRDVHLDAAGVVLEVEEEIDPAHLPEAVRRAIDGAAGGRSIRKVEAITKDGATEYEVAVKGGGGKFVVSSDGTVRKE
jgi:uncharacterized membrane protein YkoI